MKKNGKRTGKRRAGAVDLVPLSTPAVSFQYAILGAASAGVDLSISIPIPIGSPFRVRKLILDVTGTGLIELTLQSGDNGQAKTSRAFIVSADIRTVVMNLSKDGDRNVATSATSIALIIRPVGATSTATVSGTITGSYFPAPTA